jgi:glycerate kinase
VPHLPTPTVVVASDSFKGSLTSLQVADAVGLGLRDVVPSARVVPVPVADGGEGTVAAALASGWRGVAVPVHGPTGEPGTATVATSAGPRGPTALVELADACGLGRLPGGMAAPLTASSRGLGDAVRGALDLGAREVVVGVGGSASTDGGAGMLAALGARLLDADGRELPDGGAALAGVARVDLAGLDPRLAQVRLVLAADVKSPLLGPTGAAAVFGPQKGASPADVTLLEDALRTWAVAVARAVAERPGAVPPSPDRPALEHRPRSDGGRSTDGPELGHRPGTGAAGGVGFALLGVLGAHRRTGVDVVLDLVRLEDSLRGADLLVTGEGTLDEQTLVGKAVSGVARRGRAYGIPVVAVCGRLRLDSSGLATLGLRAAYPLSELEPDPVRSVRDAAGLLRRTGRTVARTELSSARG